MFFGTFGFLGRCPGSSEHCAFGARPDATHWDILFASVASVFKSGVRERGNRPNKFPSANAGSAFNRRLLVHAGDTRQLSLEMRDRARRRVVCIEITESPAQQPEQFRLAMIALGANLNQLNKIRRSLRTQIIAANSGERIFQDDFRERMQIGFAASHDRNFSLEK